MPYRHRLRASRARRARSSRRERPVRPRRIRSSRQPSRRRSSRRTARPSSRRSGTGSAVVQGAAETGSYLPFRQNNHFFYLTGVEVPRAIVLWTGGRRRRCCSCRRGTSGWSVRKGRCSRPGPDAARLTGIADVRPREAFGDAFTAAAGDGRVVYTPARGESVAAVTPDSAMRCARGRRRGPVGCAAVPRGRVLRRGWRRQRPASR